MMYSISFITSTLLCYCSIWARKSQPFHFTRTLCTYHLKSNTIKRINTANGYWSKSLAALVHGGPFVACIHARYKWKRPIDLVFIFILLKTWNKFDKNCPAQNTAQRKQGYTTTSLVPSSQYHSVSVYLSTCLMKITSFFFRVRQKPATR